MKRRNLLVRTIAGGLSASVFSAAGWLMGTRSLTMATGGSPGPWVFTWYNNCNNNEMDCDCVEASTRTCDSDFGCQGPGPNAFCRFLEQTTYRCCQLGGTCMLASRLWTCASCSACGQP